MSRHSRGTGRLHAAAGRRLAAGVCILALLLQSRDVRGAQSVDVPAWAWDVLATQPSQPVTEAGLGLLGARPALFGGRPVPASHAAARIDAAADVGDATRIGDAAHTGDTAHTVPPRADVLVLDATGGWTQAGALPFPWAPGASLQDDDGVLLLGGADGRGAVRSVARVQLDAAGRVVTTALPDAPRAGPLRAARSGTRVCVSFPGAPADDAALYVLDRADALPAWRVVPLDARTGAPMPRPRAGAVAAARLGDGRTLFVLVADDTAWGWLPADGAWRLLAPPPGPAPVVGSTAWTSHTVWWPAPGRSADDAPHGYHPITDTWRALPAAQTPVGVAATTLSDGRLLALDAHGALHAARPLRTARALGWVDGSIVSAYLATLLVIGVYFARRTRGLADYLLAGRRLPGWVAGLSIHGTQISAITFLATPALAWATDLRYLPTWLAILAMAPVIIALYLPFFRQFDATTAYEYLERRFSPAVRVTSSIAFMSFQLARIAIVLYLPALALAAVTGLGTSEAILVMGGLATLYTVLGGLAAVAWTDVVQVAVLFGGVTCAFVLALRDVTDLGASVDVARTSGKLLLWDGAFRWTDAGSWSLMIGAFFLQFGPYTTDQAVVQRYLAVRDEHAAARALWCNGWMSIPAALLFPTLGAVLWIWFRAHPEALPLGMSQDEVFPVFMAERLPVGVAGLVVAGLLAAAMSTLDSSLHSVTTAFVHDIHRRWAPLRDDAARLRLARRVTVGVGVLGTVGALVLARWDIASLFLFFQTAVGLLSSGVAGAFLLGIVTRRAHAVGVLVGMAGSTGLLVAVVWGTSIHTFWYGFLGLAACVVVGWTASVALPGAPAPPGTTWWDGRRARRTADDVQ